jgi:D-sedoheptulose 7-phosphate isomerase
MSFIKDYLNETIDIANRLDDGKVEQIVTTLDRLRFYNGRVFVLGIGGSSGNASHFVNDLRKICGIEAYAPTDQVPYLTAITNDESWDNVFVKYLETSNFISADSVFVLSVSGNTDFSPTSKGLLYACDYAYDFGGTVMGILGKAEGNIYKNYERSCLLVPSLEDYRHVFPHAEEFQGIITHAIVTHPTLCKEAH